MASAQNDPRHAGTIWATNVDEPRPDLKPSVAAQFRRLGPESAELLATVMSGTPLAEILRRFQAGQRCYTAWVDDHPAAYGWVSFDEEYVGELNLRVRLVPGEVYIWDCFTLPAYRRHGLYAALLVHILRDLEKDSVCRAWIGADADNIASQRGIARAGFRAVADMVLARVFAMRLVWVQARPGMPEGAVAEARRAFLDNRDSVWLKAMELFKSTAAQNVSSSAAPQSELGTTQQPSMQDVPSSTADPAASHSSLH